MKLYKIRNKEGLFAYVNEQRLLYGKVSFTEVGNYWTNPKAIKKVLDAYQELADYPKHDNHNALEGCSVVTYELSEICEQKINRKVL